MFTMSEKLCPSGQTLSIQIFSTILSQKLQCMQLQCMQIQEFLKLNGIKTFCDVICVSILE